MGDLQPSSARMVLISKAAPEDRKLHATMEDVLGERSMAALSAPELVEIIRRAAPPDTHPINELVLDADLEDAALKGIQGTTRLLRRRSGRRLSRLDLKAALDKAEETGLKGETFVNAYLAGLKKHGQIRSFEWVSVENPIAPKDFSVDVDRKNSFLIDVKSTEGDFDRPIHLSANELLEMQESPLRYDLYRVYQMGEVKATLRIGSNLRKFAKGIQKALDALPAGVTADSVSVRPSVLTFGDPIEITLPDEPEGE